MNVSALPRRRQPGPARIRDSAGARNPGWPQLANLDGELVATVTSAGQHAVRLTRARLIPPGQVQPRPMNSLAVCGWASY